MYWGAVWPQHKFVVNIGVNIHLSGHTVSKAKSSEWSVRMSLTACDTEVPVTTCCVCWKKLTTCNYIVLLSLITLSWPPPLRQIILDWLLRLGQNECFPLLFV